jgi:hypothetical protein
MDNKITMQCETCGSEIRRYQCQVHEEKVYCSKSCAGKAKRNGSWLNCHMCDSKFYRRYGEQDLDIGKNQFCSKNCYFDWRRANSKKSTYLKIGAVHIHRIVAESFIGRKLSKDEVVHHIDNDKKNNHPSNLVIFPSQQMHAICHFRGMSNEELEKYSLENIRRQN